MPTRTLPSVARQPLGPGLHYLEIAVADTSRTYIVHVPQRYDGRTSAPVVIMLHGEGTSGRTAARETAWATKADQAGFLAVFPNALPRDPSRPVHFFSNPRIWRDGSHPFNAPREAVNDVDFFEQLVGDLDIHLAIDRRRIFVAGFSNGGSMAFRLASALTKKIAAIGVVGGYLWLEPPKLDSRVPLLYMAGSDDPLVPRRGGKVKVPGEGFEIRPPVGESITAWARLIGCLPQPLVVKSSDGVTVATYGGGKRGSEIVCYTIEGLGHVWPGGQRVLSERIVGKASKKVKATDVMWDFFRKHPRM